MRTTRTLHPETRQEIEDELACCRQTQAWSVGSTRTGWADQLAAILAADDNGGDVAAAVAVARAEAERLATIVAERLAVDVSGLHRDAVKAGIDEDDLPDPDTATIAEMIAAIRTTAVDVDSAVWGARDGWTVTGTVAAVTATVRTWDPERTDVVWVAA